MSCEHIRAGVLTEPEGGEVCRPCVEVGDRWVHLRACTSCGVIRCCDSSPNRHATAHAEQSGHPVVRSYEPGGAWWWCYPDQRFAEQVEGYGPLRT